MDNRNQATNAVLVKIANIFAENNIQWALGGSSMLYMLNIVDDYQDLDIMVSGADFEKADMLLKQVATELVNNPDPVIEGLTELHHDHLQIDDSVIDLVGGMVIMKDNKKYTFLFNPSLIENWVFLDGAKIPLYSVNAWYDYYKIMGRTTRIKQIEAYLNKEKSMH